MSGLRRIFYDTETGERIVEVGRSEGMVIPSVERDIETYSALSGRNKNTFDLLEIPFNSYAQDFAESSDYRVNPKTKKLEFSYPDPNQPNEPQPYHKPLTEQIEELRTENIATMEALAEVYEMALRG